MPTRPGLQTAAVTNVQFLLVVHYFDPHVVDDPPQPYRERFAAPEDQHATEHLFGTFGQMQALRQGLFTLPAQVLGRLAGLYDGEVAYVDAEFGRLLQGLRELGVDRHAALAVLSDHGEEFGDHRGFEHGHTQYDELLHVPVLIDAPVIDSADVSTAGTVVKSVIGLRDIAPTLCALVGIASQSTFNGQNLESALLGQPMKSHAVLSQGNMWGAGQAALRQGRWKIILEADAATDSTEAATSVKLFDMANDPGEQQNVADQNPDELSIMLRNLESRIQRQVHQGEAPRLSEEERRRLKLLVYVK